MGKALGKEVTTRKVDKDLALSCERFVIRARSAVASKPSLSHRYCVLDISCLVGSTPSGALELPSAVKLPLTSLPGCYPINP